MPLTEKELTHFLREEPEACEARGLTISQDFYAYGRHYQRLDLGPYGIAQLVNVRYVPETHRHYVQVVSLTVGNINLKQYQQAQRHAAAIRTHLLRELQAADLPGEVLPECVLLGRRIQLAGDLVFSLSVDARCQAFTYDYGPEGVYFENIGKRWYKAGSEQHPALQQLGRELLDLRQQALALATVEPGALPLAAPEVGPQDYATLTVTAEGILQPEAPGPAPDSETDA